jgi:hypothetical protein
MIEISHRAIELTVDTTSIAELLSVCVAIQLIKSPFSNINFSVENVRVSREINLVSLMMMFFVAGDCPDRVTYTVNSPVFVASVLQNTIRFTALSPLLVNMVVSVEPIAVLVIIFVP